MGWRRPGERSSECRSGFVVVPRKTSRYCKAIANFPLASDQFKKLVNANGNTMLILLWLK